MAAAPKWKVYGAASAKSYRASCKDPSDAAILVAVFGAPATIRYGHNLIVWREGFEVFSASWSYDEAARIMYARADGRDEGGEVARLKSKQHYERENARKRQVTRERTGR